MLQTLLDQNDVAALSRIAGAPEGLPDDDLAPAVLNRLLSLDLVERVGADQLPRGGRLGVRQLDPDAIKQVAQAPRRYRLTERGQGALSAVKG